MFSSQEIANIILSVTLIATFIGIFFFAYGSWIEKKVLSEQMDFIIKDLCGNVKIIAPGIAEVAKSYTANLKPPNLKIQDELVKKHNDKLLKKAFTVLGVIFILGLLITFGMSKYYNFSFMKLGALNIITLLSVALTEFTFLTFFGKNYKSADPNVVKKAIVQSLKKYSES